MPAKRHVVLSPESRETSERLLLFAAFFEVSSSARIPAFAQNKTLFPYTISLSLIIQ